MQFQRTNEVMTAGITNIPLTKPAYIYFTTDIPKYECALIENIYNVFDSMNIPFTRTDNHYTNRTFFISQNEIDSKHIKMIWRNFKTLRPKVKGNWRYLFWEIDDSEETALDKVIAIYRILKLPMYVHRSMRGYHFLSVKPITKELWNWAITQLRDSNETYPPITLRVKPNKYINEDKIFNEGFIIAENYHSDTKQLRDWIVNQNLVKLGEQYQLVNYPFPKQEELDNMGYEQRLEYQQRQIEESI